MYKSLLEITDPNIIRLTDTQKAVLLSIFSAQTPELAYESTTGSIPVVNARDYLIKTGLIIAGSGQLKITGHGSDVLEDSGLLDHSGEVTEIGLQLIDQFNEQKRKFDESLSPFRTLKNEYNGAVDLSLLSS